MIKVIEKKTLCGDVLKTYQLTQGDSFRFRAYAKQNNSLPLISSIVFKLLNNDYKILFKKEYIKKDVHNWYLSVNADETALWKEGKDYHTEIEVTYIDGQVDTIEKASLIVELQGIEEA